ncbi:MAG TPA: nucleotidyltransferase domain-containing protein [Chitinophagaceae bacterium]|nr:nucleotidyltransferase domain-containing protein [Chitinophagaceae bacterium]
MKKTIDKIISYAVEVAQPEKIILFGSVAKGKSNVNSDVDLLIVTDNTYLKPYLVKQIESFAREFSLSVDVLMHSQEELEKASLNSSSFLASVIKYGKIIYKKTA